MSNDFSGDTNCKALWRFESGALTTDSKGGNTLTDHNTVAEDTSDYKEGACCADFERDNSEYFSCTDANLDAGFPLKNGDSNKKISVCFWYKPESSVEQYFVSKFGSWSDKRSFMIGYLSTNKIRLYIGYNGGVSSETVDHLSDLTVGRWYHIGVTFQDSDKAYKIRIWDDFNSQILGSDKTGNTTNSINIEDAEFHIGSHDGAGNFLDGKMDEVVIFNDILTTSEIDEIRAGTYGAVAEGAIRWKFNPFTGNFDQVNDTTNDDLFKRHTLESGDDLTINEDEQKLNHGDFTVNSTGSLTIDGSGELCIING